MLRKTRAVACPAPVDRPSPKCLVHPVSYQYDFVMYQEESEQPGNPAQILHTGVVESHERGIARVKIYHGSIQHTYLSGF